MASSCVRTAPACRTLAGQTAVLDRRLEIPFAQALAEVRKVHFKIGRTGRITPCWN
jgi:DNA ligase (NAD+)